MAWLARVRLAFTSWRTVPRLFSSCRARSGALAREAQHPFWDACCNVSRSHGTISLDGEAAPHHAGGEGGSALPHSIHRWLTELEHTACGLERPRVVRGWQEVTCQRCLGSIHAKLAQLQPSERPHEPQGHSHQRGAAPGRLQHAAVLMRVSFRPGARDI